MKRGTPRHPKTKALSRRLSVPLFSTVGLLELLWHFAGEFTPRGDVGKMSNADIAEAVGWTEDPDVLIEALIEERWLDEHSAYRLLVHDWHEHCDDAVRKKLHRAKQEFITTIIASCPSIGETRRDGGGPTRAEGLGSGSGSLVFSKEINSLKGATTKSPEPESIEAPWIRAGFESPEGFQVWFTVLYSEHPTRGAFEAAKITLVEEILAGRLKRADFEAGYEAHRKSAAWARDGGRYIPKLSVFCHDKGWMFPPKELPEARASPPHKPEPKSYPREMIR